MVHKVNLKLCCFRSFNALTKIWNIHYRDNKNIVIKYVQNLNCSLNYGTCARNQMGPFKKKKIEEQKL